MSRENNDWSCDASTEAAIPLSSRVRVDMTLIWAVWSLEDCVQIVWRDKKKKWKRHRGNPWLWHADILTISNLKICFFLSPIGHAIFLCAWWAFTFPLRKASSSFPPFYSRHLYPPLTPSLPYPSFILLLSISGLFPCLFPLWHNHKSRGLRGSCLRWGVIICTVCKLSGRDELASVNRPLQSDTDGTSIGLN